MPIGLEEKAPKPVQVQGDLGRHLLQRTPATARAW